MPIGAAGAAGRGFNVSAAHVFETVVTRARRARDWGDSKRAYKMPSGGRLAK